MTESITALASAVTQSHNEIQSTTSESSRGRGNRNRGRRRQVQTHQHDNAQQHDSSCQSNPRISGDQSQSNHGDHVPRRGGRRGRGGSGYNTSTTQSRTSQQNGVSATLIPSESIAGPDNVIQGHESKAGGSAQDTPRSRRRGQSSRGQHIISTRGAGVRQFGGQLTRNDADNLPFRGELNVDAEAFTPGSVTNQASKRQAPPKDRQKYKASPSTASDIATRIHEDINNRIYECSICTNIISRRDKIWSCHTCWSVLHLKCVKQWSTKSLAAQVSRDNTNNQQPQTWRCPGCNLPKEDRPNLFTCWCSKETDPSSLPGLPPFSCGQTCNRARACPHACAVTCHAGPCEPCRQMGPTQGCFCGLEERTRVCLQTDYTNGWSCGQVCNEVMPCGEHYCGRPCHEGLCGACEVPVEASCYCGQDHSIIPCCDRGDALESIREDSSCTSEVSVKRWMGTFDCGNPCKRQFDCGKHICENPCHPQDQTTPHCPRSPDVVTHCPCGKTVLADLMSTARVSCDDEIALCSTPCGKALPCGHACTRVCHAGECYPCLSKTEISCHCGKTVTPTMCHQGTPEPPSCLRICRAMLNCARHECGEHCCSGERKAVERIASRKKMARILNSSLGPELNFEAEHICTRTCDRPLKCGNHRCPDLCHRGPCSSCREAIFEEISCHCGKTVLQPPLPCGTQPPPCRFDCERRKSCGHPQVSHPCHTDDDPCPKCPFLTTKPCLCGKNKLKNQPCGTELVRCGEICGKKLKCGWHTCRKGCHRAGECEDATTSCAQACGKDKTCGHPCSAICHSPFPCKEEKACEHKIIVTCACQRIKQEARCGASKHSMGNTEKILACDDECARLERNRKLQLALNIPADHQDDHVPYSADTINKYLSNPTWSSLQEKLLRTFAADPDQKRLRLKPMKRPQRAFIHSLSQDFGFDSESLDPEPHRHVALFKTPKFVMAPMKMLSDCVRIRQSQAAAATAAVTSLSLNKDRNTISTVKMSNDPFNALLLTNVKFGLTTDELRRACVVAGVKDDLDITFLLSEEVVVQPAATATVSSTPASAPVPIPSTWLTTTKPIIQAAVTSQQLGAIQECRVDSSLNLLRREDEDATASIDGVGDSGGGGWSQVAKAAGAPGRRIAAAQPIVSRSSFVVLGSQAHKMKNEKKKRKNTVVENWEDEDDNDGAIAAAAAADEVLEGKEEEEQEHGTQEGEVSS